MLRSPPVPVARTRASSAASATHMSEGWVAMQCSLVRRIACMRLIPSIAEQPLPGSRLLQGVGDVVEIQAARSGCQEIAPGRGHVAQLLRGPCEDRTGQQRVARLDLRVVGEIAVGDQRADPQTAVVGLLDLVQRQMRDVN